MRVFGRREERQAIDQRLDAARSGRSGELVIRGEPGMGKTTLLDYAVAAAEDMRVTRLAGIEAEAEFGFAALQRLCIPLMDGYERLPTRQRDALGAAFGMVAGPPPDRFLVGLAALTLLADAASARPLLCIVDDVQWVDRESIDALAFVGRRLYADRIVLLLAIRASPEARLPLEGLSMLQVDGLPEDDAIALLDSVAAAPVDREIARRIVNETRGCPLAVRELVAGLSSEQLARIGVLPDPLPIGSRLETHFLARVRVLPEDSQVLLLLAAADPTGDRSLLWRAAEHLGIGPSAADAVEDTRLVQLHPRVEFRHPIVRSAIYGGATALDRRRVHAALAAVSDRAADQDARVWHLAAAAVGPDAAIAAELEDGARRARRRGRYAADAALLSRSAELTPDPGERARRLLTAAQLHHVAGAPRVARTLLDGALPQLQDPLLRAEATRLRAALDSYAIPAKIPAVLLRAAQALESLDVRLARNTYGEALQACMVSGELTLGTTPIDIARAALAAPPSPEAEPTILDLVTDGFANLIAVGYEAAAPILRRAVQRVRTDDLSETGFAHWSALGGMAATELWDEAANRAMLVRLEASERERGALDSLRITLGGLGHAEMWAGRFAAAEACHSEATDISVALGAQPFHWELLKVELYAWQGREEETRSIASIMTSNAVEVAGAGVVRNLALVALTVLELGRGEYGSAHQSSWQVFERDLPPQGTRILPDVVEAAARAGELDRARVALERLTARARVAGTPWALGLLARSEALLADDERAEALYIDAIERLGDTRVATDLARARLLYGEWLRRQNRRLEARAELSAAFDAFSGMGAAAFAERARAELAATGASARRRAADTGEVLTPQEAQIAALAAMGATKVEIATRLFLSASTIDYHLRKVYRKLGVASRRELRRARPDLLEGPASATA